jgi:hypothetical protein
MVGEILRDDDAMNAARKVNLSGLHEDVRRARIRKDIVCSSTLPINAWKYALDRSRSEPYFPPSNPKRAT